MTSNSMNKLTYKLTYYRLTRPLPTFEVGDVFKINNSGHLEYVKGAQDVKEGQQLIAYTKMTLDKFPNILKDWFEELPNYSPYKKWRGEIGDVYWFIDDTGKIAFEKELDSSADDYRWRTGNYFKSKSETEKYREFLYSLNVLLIDANGGGYIDGGENWIACYDRDGETYDTIDDINVVSLSGVWFQDINDLERSLDKHSYDWDIVRDYRRKNV
nr:MAG TPA: hypothetical protein [Caudoviricetes sp.]